jgi:hypothetical protein
MVFKREQLGGWPDGRQSNAALFIGRSVSVHNTSSGAEEGT